MKILVICQYYFPEQFKVTKVCEALAEKGHEITVLTGLPNYPTGNIPYEYRRGKKRDEIINNVHVIRCYEAGRKPGTIGLFLNYISYMLSSSIKALFMKKDFDLIFCYQLSPITMVFPALIVKWIARLPLYLYCCDLWPESMLNIIDSPNRLTYQIIKQISTFLYSKCDSISVSSSPFIEYFVSEHCIKRENLTYIPQFAEDKYLYMNLKKTVNDVLDIYYIGNVGFAQGTEVIVEAANLIKSNEYFKIHIVGTGSAIKSCKALVSEYGLAEVIHFHGYHGAENIEKFLELADACILTLKHQSVIGLTLPLKLLSYMAAGKPVIASIDGSAKDVIKSATCGICVDAGDSIGLSEAIVRFIDLKDELWEIGIKGRDFYKSHFTREKHIDSVQIQMSKLIERKAGKNKLQ